MYERSVSVPAGLTRRIALDRTPRYSASLRSIYLPGRLAQNRGEGQERPKYKQSRRNT